MPEYKVRLKGIGARNGGMPGPIMRHLIDTIDDGGRGAVRLRLEGRSSGRGVTPAWLEAASAFDVVDFTDSAVGLRLRAPTLREALPDRFRQTELFPKVDPNESAIALLLKSLGDAVRGQEDSEAYDGPLLAVFERFSVLFARGVEEVEIANERRESTVRVAPGSLETIRQLRRTTPQPRRARIVGRIDAIRYSDRAFTLVLEDGSQLRGVLTEGAPEYLAPLFGKRAIVSGLIRYRPSGSVLRMEAERLAPATAEDAAAWSKLPRAFEAAGDTRTLRRPQGPRSGLAKVFGNWPGDETDEEIQQALAELS